MALGALALSVACRSQPGPSGKDAQGDTPVPEQKPSVSGETSARAPGQSSPVSRKTPAEVWTSFASAWNAAADQGGSGSELGAFRAEDGLVALDNPCAFVRLRAFEGVEGLFALDGEYDLARLKKVRLRPELMRGDAPPPTCEGDPSVKGVFLVPVRRFELDLRFGALRQYELASEEEIARLRGVVDAARAKAHYAVYDLEQNVGFLFGFEGEKPVLLGVDAVIPCSA